MSVYNSVQQQAETADERNLWPGVWRVFVGLWYLYTKAIREHMLEKVQEESKDPAPTTAQAECESLWLRDTVYDLMKKKKLTKHHCHCMWLIFFEYTFH